MTHATRLLAGGLAALLWTTGAQACFVVANGAITFNSMVSPPGCGGIPNAFPTQAAAQNFLNSLQNPAPSGGTAVPTTTPATTTVTGAAAASMPSTAMQVFMLTTPDTAAAVNHQRLLYTTMLDHPDQRKFADLGLAGKFLVDYLVDFTNFYYYNYQLLLDEARARWELTPEGKAARARIEAARQREEEERRVRNLPTRTMAEQQYKYQQLIEYDARIKNQPPQKSREDEENDARIAFEQSAEGKEFKERAGEQIKFASDKQLFRIEADGRESPQFENPMPPPPLLLPGSSVRPPDGPPESILDSIGDFVPIS